MQTSKLRNGSSEVSQRTSPATPRSARVAKTGGSESDSSTNKSTPTKTPTNRSPKIIERRSPRSPVTERKRPSRVTELECQLTKLQEDLKKTKDQLGTSESWRRRAQQEAEDAKKQLSAMSTKREESQKQLTEFSAAEEARLQELRKISQERDRAWESEIEAIQKQHSMDSAALTNALNEIHRLRQQLQMLVKSESSQMKQSETAHSKLQKLKEDVSETYSIIDNLNAQLRNSEKAEAEARMIVIDTQQDLEMANATVGALHAEGLKLVQSISLKASELEESRARVSSLEETVKKLQGDLHDANHEILPDKNTENVRYGILESEVEQLRSALEAAEVKYQEEQIQSTMQVHSAYELVESVKTDYEARETKLESSLGDAKSEIAELKTRLADKEKELQSISEMNKELSASIGELKQMEPELGAELLKSVADIAELKADLMDKETALQSISEENELLKAEMEKKEMERRKSYEEAITEVELARAAEQDALMRLHCVTEEADKSSRRSARVADQLEAAQATNAEMEAELSRLRVQSDQWRKAAESAADALMPSGRLLERTNSDTYHTVAGKLMSSPPSDDLDDESPKQKNGKMIRRLSGLWKRNLK